MSETNEASPATNGSDLERLVRCRWYRSHKWSKWGDIATAENKSGHPVVIQERRCQCCNKAQRHLVLCST